MLTLRHLLASASIAILLAAGTTTPAVAGPSGDAGPSAPADPSAAAGARTGADLAVIAAAPVTDPATVLPSAPSAASAESDVVARTATLRWAAPGSDGGSPITGYRVARDGLDASGGGAWSTVVPASARSHVFRNLAPGALYNLTVTSISGLGSGAGSTVSLRTLADDFSRPRAVSATTVDGTLAATVRWSAATDSAVTAYRVTAHYAHKSEPEPVVVVLPVTARSHVFTNIRTGVVHDLSVEALRGGTASAPVQLAARTVAPMRSTPVPSVSGTRSPTYPLTAVVSWDPSPYYRYQWLRDGAAIPGATGKKYLLTTEDAGTRVAVVVRGTLDRFVPAARTSESDAISLVAVPSAPQSVSSVTDPSARSATLRWSVPWTAGTSPITGYRVSRDGTDAFGGGPWSTVVPATARTHLFRSLRAGYSYTLTVRALSADGAGKPATVSVYLPVAP